MDHPDEADVIAAASGDIAAFERLVRNSQGAVWRYVAHIAGDHALAEDITQEVLVRMHKKLHTLREPTRFNAWLLTMARNAAYDAGRRKRRRPLELVGDRELPADQVIDPHIDIEVNEALNSLEIELREALVLVGMIGLSYSEAGEALGIPEGTVKSRVFRARKAMLNELGEGTTDGR